MNTYKIPYSRLPEVPDIKGFKECSQEEIKGFPEEIKKMYSAVYCFFAEDYLYFIGKAYCKNIQKMVFVESILHIPTMKVIHNGIDKAFLYYPKNREFKGAHTKLRNEVLYLNNALKNRWYIQNKKEEII